MLRAVVLGALTVVLPAVAVGCGGAQEPREQDIWYTASLRPGSVPPETQGERELLARMDEVPTGQSVTFGGQTFVADEPYTAASGRSCRAVRVRPSPDAEQVEVKLACEEASGWVWVPDVFEGEDHVAEAVP